MGGREPRLLRWAPWDLSFKQPRDSISESFHKMQGQISISRLQYAPCQLFVPRGIHVPGVPLFTQPGL